MYYNVTVFANRASLCVSHSQNCIYLIRNFVEKISEEKMQRSLKTEESRKKFKEFHSGLNKLNIID